MTSLKRTLVAAGAFAAATSFFMCSAIPPGYAYGDAPWCAVINIGKGVTWDCQYQTAEQCIPNVIAGNRGFCNLNPDPRPTPVAKARYHKKRAAAK
jgi:hypothetical protein